MKCHPPVKFRPLQFLCGLLFVKLGRTQISWKVTETWLEIGHGIMLWCTVYVFNYATANILGVLTFQNLFLELEKGNNYPQENT